MNAGPGPPPNVPAASLPPERSTAASDGDLVALRGYLADGGRSLVATFDGVLATGLRDVLGRAAAPAYVGMRARTAGRTSGESG